MFTQKPDPTTNLEQIALEKNTGDELTDALPPMSAPNTPEHHATFKAPSVWSDAPVFLLWLIVAVIIGAYSQYWGLGFFVAFMGYGIWRLYHTQRFLTWIAAPSNNPPPEMIGTLGAVATHLYDRRKQERQAQLQLLGLSKKIRSSLLSLQNAVILLNDNDGIEWWNQAAEKLLSLTSADKNNSILNLIPVSEFHHYYNTATTPNNGIHLVFWQNPNRYLKCEVTHFGSEKLLMIYDVTRLQHLEHMRRDFVANVSHELRTPLTVLMGYLETFSDQPDLAPNWQRGFELMTQQTARMNSIVNDLLLLSRLENDEAPDQTCIDMPQLISQIFEEAKTYNKDFGHDISLDIQSQQHIFGAAFYLTSALQNLVVNAIKYTPKGGDIRITWRQGADGMEFVVTDNGIGIAPAHIERLTERFYRVDSGRSRNAGGTGLGLAIVKHVLYQHDATLKIDSAENKGSTFRIIFAKRRNCF